LLLKILKSSFASISAFATHIPHIMSSSSLPNIKNDLNFINSVQTMLSHIPSINFDDEQLYDEKLNAQLAAAEAEWIQLEGQKKAERLAKRAKLNELQAKIAKIKGSSSAGSSSGPSSTSLPFAGSSAMTLPSAGSSSAGSSSAGSSTGSSSKIELPFAGSSAAGSSAKIELPSEVTPAKYSKMFTFTWNFKTSMGNHAIFATATDINAARIIVGRNMVYDVKQRDAHSFTCAGSIDVFDLMDIQVVAADGFTFRHIYDFIELSTPVMTPAIHYGFVDYTIQRKI
jgi:hypothetical protein